MSRVQTANMKSIRRFDLILGLLGVLAFAAFSVPSSSGAEPAPGVRATAVPTAADTALFAKPAWLTDLSLGDREYYDDNVLLVSGLGMPIESSWVNDATFKLGIDFAPLLADGNALQTFTLVYAPERVAYAQDSAENYTAHRLNDSIKGSAGYFSYSLDNAFLDNDGSKLAATYALNQVSGAAANQNDKYRNNFTHAVPRERRNQDQDRSAAQVRRDIGRFFFRAISNLTDYNLNTTLFNTSFAPYKGYQDYIDRWDINGGADLGYQLSPKLDFFVGDRDGYQHQDQFSPGMNSDRHFASNHYQRVLFGLEGQLADWLNVKAAFGPDARDYNPATPIDHDRTTRLYGEAQATAILSKTQTLSFNFKQWLFVSSTGLVPYGDISYALTYHWSVTKQLGLDLGAKYLEASYTLGNDYTGSAPSLRDDIDWQGSAGLSYAILPHLTANVTYTYDKGLNGLETLAATYAPAYRDFEHEMWGFGLLYKF
jgi:hypothetical protein